MPECNAKPSRIVAWGVTLLVLLIYLALAQDSYWGDGRRLMAMVSVGRWHYHHVLYLPLAHLFQFVFQPIFGSYPETAMVILAATCTAGGVGLVTRAASLLGASNLAAVAGGLLTAATPTLLFFGTSVEVHAPQVLATGLALCTYAHWQRNQTRPNAFILMALFLGLIGTHITGAIWAPGFLFYSLFGTGKFRLPSHIVPGILLAAVAFYGWQSFNPDGSPAPSLLSSSMLAIFEVFRFDYIASEFLATGACLFVLPLVLLFKTVREWHTLSTVALLIVPPVIMFQTLHIEEQGAYFISVFPLLGLLSSIALSHLGRAALPIALVLIPFQGFLAGRMLHEWQTEYRGSEWAEPLIEEVEDNALLLSLDNWETYAVLRHSHLDAFSLRIIRARKLVEHSLDDPATRDLTASLIEKANRTGQRIAVTRSLIEYGAELDSLGRFLKELTKRYGAPVPGKHPDYLLYPASSP